MADQNPTELGVPQWWQFMYPLLQVASDGRDWARRDFYPAAVERAGVPEELRLLQHKSGDFVAEHRAGWAKSGLVRARLLETVSRGVFRITDDGRNFLAAHLDGFSLADVESLPAWEEYQPKIRRSQQAVGSPLAEDATADLAPDDLLDAAESSSDQAVSAELLQKLRDGDWKFFERTVLRLLTKMGYGTEGAALRRTTAGDGGIDGVINRDSLGLDRIYIQAKRFRESTVSSDTVRTFLGSLDTQKANFGVFFTTSRFTTDAVDAAHWSSKSVVLVDGPTLAGLMIKHRVGTQVRRTVEIVEIDEDFFE